MLNVNIRDEADTKWTALINTAYWDKISCLQILLYNEADPDSLTSRVRRMVKLP